MKVWDRTWTQYFIDRFIRYFCDAINEQNRRPAGRAS